MRQVASPQPPQNTTAFQPPALAPGTFLLHRYVIHGYIGGGGFGHIYRAQDVTLGHCRAIKEAFYRDPNTQRQFRLEAEFLLNTRHPNLVRGYAVFEQYGRLYLVMDYVDGRTLEDIAIEQIRRTGRPPDEAQVLDWMLPICDALHTLHVQPVPIIHRDVKPANIKLSATLGIPVLIDLGLAKLYQQGQQTIGAALAFTPGYAPPEQYQAAGATDQRTDVYGLGATLFYLLTGYQPTEAPARLSAHALPSLRSLNPALSERTDAVVQKAMTLDPAQRYQSGLELEAELRACRAALAAPVPPLLHHGADTSPALPIIADTARRPAWRAGQNGAAGGHMGSNMGSDDASNGAASHGQLDDDATHPPVCARCGAQNASAARFCRRCGTALKAGGAVVAPPSPARPPVAPLAAAVEASAYAPLRHALAPEAASQPTSPPATPREAQASIFAFVAAVCLVISFLAPFFSVTLIFLPLALGLTLWSWLTLRELRAAPREFFWMAGIVGGLGSLWFWFWFARLAYLLMLHI
ncbi:MAG: serine/threonine-protein kinase [Ktedonobacterales bacterium]